MKHIFDFRNYDLTLACEIDARHGISGHIFELIEYFYYFKFWHNVNCNIFIPFAFDINNFKKCLGRYSFTEQEIQTILESTTIAVKPNITLMNTAVFVDGAVGYQYCNGLIRAKRKILIRCNEDRDLAKGDVVLQDSRLYGDLPNSVHYVKKLLFDKFKKVPECPTDTALIYATTNCRGLSFEYLNHLKQKYKNINDFLIISNEDLKIPDKFRFEKVPVDNIFSKFNRYIYTQITSFKCTVVDCSPRFVAECKYFNREVLYDIPYFYRGLNVRKFDIDNHFEKLFLTKSDPIINYI